MRSRRAQEWGPAGGARFEIKRTPLRTFVAVALARELDFARVEYDDTQCQAPLQVVLAAERAVGQHGIFVGSGPLATEDAGEAAQFGYNPFSYNCENFAVQCKTGQSRCKQMEQLVLTGYEAVSLVEQLVLLFEPFLVR